MTPIKNEWDDYELFKPFFDGMVDAALDTVVFIDGNESSYYFLSKNAFEGGRNAIVTSYDSLVPSVHEKFKKLVQVSSAVYVDGVLNLWNSPRFIGYYFLNNTERSLMIQHNTYYSLQTADEYVWIYNENMNYFKGVSGKPVRIPKDLPISLRRAKRKVAADTTLGFSVGLMVRKAKREYDRRIFINGVITTNVDNSGVKMISGFNNEYGDESACIVYNAYGNYDCVFPYNITVTTYPSLHGASFQPQKRRYLNLVESKGEQIFIQH